MLQNHTLNRMEKTGAQEGSSRGRRHGGYFVFRICSNRLSAHKELQEAEFVFYFSLICSGFLGQSKSTYIIEEIVDI